MRLKRIITGIVLTAVVITGSLMPATNVSAKVKWPNTVRVDSGSAIVMVQETGTVLYEKKADKKHYPASITKILTALVALEHSELDEVVTFSREAVAQSAGGTSSIWRDYGEKMTMEQCLYGMMLESANECAWAIGEHVGGGDINVFIDMMNAKAKELGCTHSQFRNPNGLPDEDHWTSARDMALISRAAYANPEFAKITGTKTYVIPKTNKHKDKTYLNNHHCMLHYFRTGQYLYDYCVGGKTGYTVAAGNTLVTYAQKDGMTLIVVVMRSAKPQHWDDTRRLCDYFFDNYEVKSAAELADFSSPLTAEDIGAFGGSDNSLVEVKEGDVVVLPKKAKKSDLKITSSRDVPEGDSEAIGTLNFTYGDHEVGTTPIYTTGSDTIGYTFHNMDTDGEKKEYIRIDFLTIGLWTLAGIAVIIALISVIRLIRSNQKRRTRGGYALKKETPKYKVIKDNNRKKR